MASQLESGLYQIQIVANRCYLTNGLYNVTVSDTHSHFRDVITGGATFEAHSLINRLIGSGELQMTLVQSN